MQRTECLVCLAGILAATALTAGCVPALNYGAVPPEPEYTTKLTTTTAGTTRRKPFTTSRHKERTISWDEFNGTYYVAATEKVYTAEEKSTGATALTEKGTATANGTGATTVSGMAGAASSYDPLHTLSTAGGGQTLTTTLSPSGEPLEPTAQQTAAPQSAVPETVPPETAAPETAPPETAAPQTAAPVVETAAPAAEPAAPAAEPAAPAVEPAPAAEPAAEPAAPAE